MRSAPDTRTARRIRTRPAIGLRRITVLLCLLQGATGDGLLGADTLTLEYRVKSGFLLNFAKFVKWPEEAFESEEAPMVFGIYGDTRVADYLKESTRKRRCQGRAIEIRSCDQTADIKGCHVLFVARSAGADLQELVVATGKASVLVIGDDEDTCRRGAAIGFFVHERKIRFAIHVDAARRARLELSSRLLKLGKILIIE